ncbi:hypothetical protein NC653_024381 [Populus alba x Populus x berolinensis]|uniref:Uncharacterized protein n=1 Tax=Populus alba x Populus x berolinensis TaxID=444605 RepID=A0AAD6Q6I6_9ROSI|nr:hypothetical protein NC653_024381 [Populus alba x Populus x berolinensis]
MISRLHDARHFWRPGHKTFSGFIKARERPQLGGDERAGGRTETKKKKKKASRRTDREGVDGKHRRTGGKRRTVRTKTRR